MSSRLSFVRSFVATAALSLTAATQGQTFVGTLNMNDSYGFNPGGEMRAWTSPSFAFMPQATGTDFQFGPNGPTAGVFETFCLEFYEDLDYSLTYNADLNTNTVSTNANYAAGAHGGFNDILDPRTAYLYNHFIRQSLLTPYSYTEPGRTTDANALQDAIWFIEQEVTTPLSGKALQYFNEADAAVASGAWTGLGDVRVLNLYTGGFGAARTEYQDVLVLIPAPGTLALGAVGLLAAARRRR